MKKRRFFSWFLIIIMATSIFHTGCGSSKKTSGVIIGATVGGAAGALLTKNNKAVGIIIGAVVGGVAGGLIGAYMDRQAKDIADDLGEDATVIREGEGIIVSFDSGLLFDFDSYALREETEENLNKLANSLQKYEKTVVHVLGHTDSRGTAEYNEKLSQDRAQSVKSYLVRKGVKDIRVVTKGYGESDPVSPNTTAENRQMNRRVEIVITANEELKEDAMKGLLSSR